MPLPTLDMAEGPTERRPAGARTDSRELRRSRSRM